jgi:hypothetical protein
MKGDTLQSIQHVLDLHQQYEETKKSTIQDLIGQKKEIDEALKALGHDPKLLPPKQKQQKKPCGTCGATDHDKRFHRRKQ